MTNLLPRILPVMALAATVLITTVVIPDAEARINSGSLDRNQIKRLVVEEALATSLPPSLALALAKVESDFQDGALSDKGARGVMQIMPRTAQGEFGVSADELWDARLNIQLGISFLEQLIERYGGRWNLALSHYNGGTLRGKGAGATAHSFNRRYVKAVLEWQKRYAAQAHVWQTDDKPRSSIKVTWTPARTVPTVAGEDDLIREDRAARAERIAARADHRQRRAAERAHLRSHRGSHEHHHAADLDDFTPHWRHRHYGHRGHQSYQGGRG